MQLLMISLCSAQELDPRSYFNLPVGSNFLLIGSFRTEGAVLPDPTPVLEDLDATIQGALLGYSRTIRLGKNSGKVLLAQPWVCFDGTGVLQGEPGERDVCGLGDTTVKVTYNFLGSPALSWKEFRHAKSGFVMGTALRVQAPTGDYDGDIIINLGSNRWRIQPEIGMSHRINRWWLELAGNVSFYTDNDDFFRGKKREQDPVYGLQGHVIYGFTNGIWLALDANYFVGGASTIDGVKNDDEFSNSRLGLTLSVPITKRHSIKFYGFSGVVARAGTTEADTIGFAYQYGWGKDFPK